MLPTEPLSAAQRAAIGWRRRQGLADSGDQFHYYRLTADDRILWGGFDAVYRYGGPVGDRFDDHDPTFARLAQHFFHALRARVRLTTRDVAKRTHALGSRRVGALRSARTPAGAAQLRTASPGRGPLGRKLGSAVVLSVLRHHPSAILLAAQLAGILAYPFMEASNAAVLSAFGVVILALAVLSVRNSPAFTGFALALGVPATVLLVIQAVTGDDALLPYSSALEAVLYFYAAGSLIAYMLADHVITRDELFAVGATFTLVAWGFAHVYVVCQAVEPGSFIAAVDPEGERTWFELLYLSSTTLTSVGLSDIVPIKPFARAVVMLEQLAGLAFVAMLLSRLVGLTVRREA